MVKSQVDDQVAKIKVIGVGGGGCNVLERMVRRGIAGAEFIAVDTDLQTLDSCQAGKKIQIGANLTNGRSADGNVNLGRQAAEDGRYTLLNSVLPAEIVFVITGMGGGTGTGAAPVISELAKKNGVPTIGIVTRPFSFEATYRSDIAAQGMAIFSQKTDTLIRISNDRLLDICGVKTTIYAAFLAVDEMIQQVVQTIVEAITKPGMINLDFMDIKSVFKDSGLAIASIGVAVGQDRAICAARASLTSALVDIPIYEATSVFLSISGANGFSLSEVNDVADIIFKAVNPEAKLIFTACHNPNLKGYLKVIMIASGSQKIHDMELINYPEDKHFYDSVGQLLKQVRIEAGRTQVECAKVTGLKSGVGYANYESGKRRIPLSRLRIISNYLGRDLAYFLRGAKESENKLLAHPTIEVDHAKPIPHQHRAIKKILVLPDKERGAEVVQKGEKRDLVWTMATIKWDSLIEQTAQYFLIETRDILSKSQNRRVSLARQIAIYLMREHSSMSFAEIGEYFTRDPSTVFNAYKKIAAYSILDSKLKQHLRLIKEKLKLPDQV